MAYRDANGRIRVGYTDCPTEHAIMVREFLRDEVEAEAYLAEQAAIEAAQAADAKAKEEEK